MHKKISLIAVAVILFMVFFVSAVAGALENLEDMEITIDAGAAFGRGAYEDADKNSFDTDLTGYRLGASVVVGDNLLVKGNYASLGKDKALQLKASDDDDDFVDGKLQNSQMNIALLYTLWEDPMLSLGGGWTGYMFKVTGPEDYVYTAERNYRGLLLAGKAEMEIIEDLKAGFSLSYAPAMSVSDKVVGAWKEPERTAESSYSGTLLNLGVDASYLVYEMIHLTVGYQFSKLTGEGEPDHPEYRFLKHEYDTHTFRLGLGASF